MPAPPLRPLFKFKITGAFYAEDQDHALRQLAELVGLLQEQVDHVDYAYNLQALARRVESLYVKGGELALVEEEPPEEDPGSTSGG